MWPLYLKKKKKRDSYKLVNRVLSNLSLNWPDFYYITGYVIQTLE